MNSDAFLSDLKKAPFHKCLKIGHNEKAYEKFKQIFLTIVNTHAPIKAKMIRGNQGPFMTRELSKEIMIRSKLRNQFNKNKTKINWKLYTV